MEQKRLLKSQRIKSYFLDAAKNMIISEGVESVSVRKVADEAGYSFVTLYNHYTDLNALLWDVKQTMINDLIEFMQKGIQDTAMDIEGIKKIFRLYIAYYLKHPNVFKFFYFHKLKRPEFSSEDPDGQYYNAMMKETFASLVLEGKIREQDIEVVGKTCIYTVHGILTLYLSGNGDMTEESICSELDKTIDYLIL
ncbi:MAG: TetR/AcrR family transcriptional regulator [Bacillota bacterium]